MKVFYNIGLSLILFLWFSNSYGQGKEILSDGNTEMILQDLMALPQGVPIHSEKAVAFKNTGNQIFLEQIGDDNSIGVHITSERRNINLIQNGNENYINLTSNVKSVSADVVQNGNNNFLMDDVFGVSQDISLQLKQNGDNLHFERHGSNSIGDNLKFEINGNSKAIIIRNFQ